eukprot:gene11093-13111_t
MVVVALEHQDGSASHATDHLGNPIKFDGGSLGLQRRSQEVLTVGASIKTGKAMASGEIAEELSRIMDTDNVFVGGHSYGCPTALLACQASKDLFRGAVLHDPAITADSMASQGKELRDWEWVEDGGWPITVDIFKEDVLSLLFTFSEMGTLAMHAYELVWLKPFLAVLQTAQHGTY